MIKVMTLNINYYGDRYGTWSIRRDLVCEAIQEERPDIIAFQAVCKDPGFEGGRDQAAQIADIFPEYKSVFFQPAVELPTGSAQGSALLSRIPWKRTGCNELTLLPGLEDENQRVLLSAFFDLPGGPLILFNGHFSWVSEQGRLNVDEALAAAGAFEGLKMLVGDLNITPESDLLKPFRAAGWSDVWAQLRPQEEGFTFIEGGRLAKRIDYVWVNRELRPAVKDIRIAASSRHETGVSVSDHVGLLVEVDLEVL